MNTIATIVGCFLLAGVTVSANPALADGFNSGSRGTAHSRGPATISNQAYQRDDRYDRPAQVIVAPVYIDRYPSEGWYPRDGHNAYSDRYGRFDKPTRNPRD